MGESVNKYVAYGAADSLFGCRDTEVLIEGPAGTGKSRGVLQKIHTAATKYAGMRALLVRKTRESMTESILVTYEEKVLPVGSLIASGAKRNCRQSYDYPNGSCIVVGGMVAGDKDRSAKIMSTEYDMIASFEATELVEDEWEKLLTRLRNGKMPYQQAIADVNPGAPTHWLNQRANRPFTVPAGMEQFLPAPRPGQTQMTRLLSRHHENPALWDMKARRWTDQGARYMATLARLTGARASRLLEGKWAATEGAVYPEYDAAVHLIPRFEIPSSWRRIRSIDFGYTNPFSCSWYALDDDGRMYRYRQIYRTKTLVADHAKEILRLSEAERIEATVADHDAEDRATLHAAGIPTIPAYKSVERGIQAIAERLRVAGDGKPRLYLMRDSLVSRDESLAEAKKPLCTEEEIEGYVWPKGQDGKPLKEEPVKENDHGVDEMRYAAAYVDDLAGSVITLISAPPIIV